jgi:D-threonate/D-erythronate kinase
MQLLGTAPVTPPDNLRIIADDLSGAAECAAALAAARRAPAPLVLAGDLPASGSWAVDTDSRATDAAAAAKIMAGVVANAAAGGSCLFKKIDSTLRGHVSAELSAVLAIPGLFEAAILCPALPEQGRTLQHGVLHVHGVMERDRAGNAVDLRRILQETGASPVLIDSGMVAQPRQLAWVLSAAVASGARVIAVDAVNDAALQRLARALLLLAPMRLLPVGSAGLAKALAAEILGGSVRAHPAGSTSPEDGVADGPVVAVIGSFSAVSAKQVHELSKDPAIEVIALPSDVWLSATGSRELPAMISKAEAVLEQGRGVALAVDGAPALESTRALVRAMAAAAEPILGRAGTLVLTGGDTARAVLDRLRIRQIDVRSEFEPGICISRQPGRSRLRIVTKAGGFGDSGALLRAMRHFQGRCETTTIARERV